MADEMRLNSLSPAEGSKRAAKRVGRGIGSGTGKTAGRLHELNCVEGDVVDLSTLKDADLIKDDVLRARVFLSGTLEKAVKVKGLKVTKGALEAIEAAGGSVEA